MNLTFKGFLKMYLAELSGMQTTNIRRLVNAANTDTPRVAEPLFVYSVVSDKLDYLLTVSEKTWMHKDYLNLSSIYNKQFVDVIDFLKSDLAPKRYAAVLDAFNAKDDILNSNRRILEKLRPKVESSLKRSGISKYKACKDLGINPGNFYAYMNGDNSKISEEIAYAVIDLGDGVIKQPATLKTIKEDDTKYEDGFNFRNGEWWIDIRVTNDEYKFFKQYATKNKIKIEDLLKNTIIDIIDNLKKENINA